ncbi:MAG: hypothetical protein K2K68_01390 [Duncaniella sp.]|nr:hypothetical protein [Duncaniella sp.]
MSIRSFVDSKIDVEELAKVYSRNSEIFVKEEKDCKDELYTLENKKNILNKEIAGLGIKKDPGYSPDWESYVNPVCETIGKIWVVCLFLVFLFHCLIWVIKLLFNISWDTWGWTKTCFFWGLGALAVGAVGALLVYWVAYKIWSSNKAEYIEWRDELQRLTSILKSVEADIHQCKTSLKNIASNRRSTLLHAMHTRLGLPVRSIDSRNFGEIRTRFFDMLENKSKVDVISDPVIRQDASLKYYDEKLRMFFDVSIPSEAISKQVLGSFSKAVEVSGSMRGDVKIKELEKKSILSLKGSVSSYTEDSLDDEIDDFNRFLEMDTSGFFTKHDSALLEKQVNGLEEVYDKTNAFCQRYSKTVETVNNALGLVRLLAYRNIYLGAELLNIIRENAGGGKLSTAFDAVELTSGLKIKKLKIEQFSTKEAIGDILSAGANAAFDMIDNGLKDKNIRKAAQDNPKAAALAVAGVAAVAAINSGIDAWKKRNAKIEGLIKKEEAIISNMEQIVDSYLDSLASNERALELIMAIIKANQGFRAIYDSLYHKVFVSKDLQSVSMMELKQLTLALQEYKKISDSKL